MNRRNSWSRTVMTLPLALIAACGGEASERTAVDVPELEREIELALTGDTTPATFEDMPIAAESAEEPQAQPTPPTPTQRPSPPPETSPVPVPAPPAQDPEPPAPEPRTETTAVPVGTTLQLSLNETLSTQMNEAGDAFTATLRDPVLDEKGDVVVPAGAVVRGRVTEVKKSGRVGETAVLSLAFEGISFGDQSYPLQASVLYANPERVSRRSTADQVGRVAVGTAAGAILGRVLGKDTRSTVKGAVIGAAAGTAIAMGTADVDAVLHAGSAMVIRLDAPITMTRVVT